MLKRVMIGCMFLLLHCTVSYANVRLPFSGNVDVQEKKLFLEAHTKQNGSVRVEGNWSLEDVYNLIISLDHIKTPFFDISTVIKSSVRLIEKSKSKFFRGDISSDYTLVNYKPVKECFGSFELRDKKFILKKLSFGNLDIEGYVQLEEPFLIDLKMKASSFRLQDIIALFVEDEGFISEGEISGDIHVFGKRADLKVQGTAYSYKCGFNGAEFDSLVLNFGGKWPLIYITDSTVTTDEGMVFKVSGALDLSSRDTLKEQIKLFDMEPLISGDEGKREWTLKKIWDEGHSGGSTELKYLLRKEGDADGFSGEESGMVGVERKIEF